MSRLQIVRRKKSWLGSLIVAAMAIVLLPASAAAEPEPVESLERITGADMSSCDRWKLCGTDLGIPYELENGSIGYLFGDTFARRNPEGSPKVAGGWRSPVLLRSNVTPSHDTVIKFDSAAGVSGAGMAPEIVYNGHRSNGEVSVIPNDGIAFPETGDHIVSFQSIRSWEETGSENWQTNYAGLAWSPDGNNFYRMGPQWMNGVGNDDPFQMWTMQRDGDWVYIFSVKAGRQEGPMVLRRVPWDQMLNPDAYQCRNGDKWDSTCSPILKGRFGEPSVQKLPDGTWVMAYLNADTGNIVTRTAESPAGSWSDEKVQLARGEHPSMYGGFIHPRSTRDNLILMVSSWVRDQARETKRYDVAQFIGSL